MGVTLCEPKDWKSDPEHLEPAEGDLIEFDRGKYHHWAIYLGKWKQQDRMVAHFNPSCDTEKVGLGWVDGKVTVDRLAIVSGSSRLRVNNLITESPRRMSQISDIVEKLANKDGYRYSLITFNCENFVTYLRFQTTSGFRAQYTGGLLNYVLPGWNIGTYDNGKVQTTQWNENVRAAEENRAPKNTFPALFYM